MGTLLLPVCLSLNHQSASRRDNGPILRGWPGRPTYDESAAGCNARYSGRTTEVAR